MIMHWLFFLCVQSDHDLSGTGCSLGIGNHSLQASSPGGPGAVWMGEEEGKESLHCVS